MTFKKTLCFVFAFVILSGAVCSAQNAKTKKASEEPITASIFLSIDAKNTMGAFSRNKIVFPQDQPLAENDVCAYHIGENLPDIKHPGFLIFKIDKRPADFDGFISKTMETVSHILSGKQENIKGIIFDMSPDNSEFGWKENDFVKLYCMLARDLKKKYPNIPVGGAGFSYVFESEADGNFKEVSKQLAYFLEFAERTGVPCELLYIKSPSLIPYGYFNRNSFLKTNVFSSLKKKPLIYDSVAFGHRGGDYLRNAILIQCFMCSFRGEADFMEIPFVGGISSILDELEKNEVEIHIEGLDRMAFIGVAGGAKDGSSVVFIFSVTSPPTSFLSSLSDDYENDFKNYIHGFSDGLPPPIYNRIRANFANMPWEGKKMKMQSYLLGKEGFGNNGEQAFDGIKDFYINRAFLPPAVIMIKFEEVKVEV